MTAGKYHSALRAKTARKIDMKTTDRGLATLFATLLLTPLASPVSEIGRAHV